MSIPIKLVISDLLLLLAVWVAAIGVSGNRIHFIVSTLPVLLFVSVAVSWRVYVRSSRTLAVRMHHAIIDGAATGALLAVLWISMLFANYALASGVWWDGSDGSDPSDWGLWASNLIQMAFWFTGFGAVAGFLLWSFNSLLLLYVFRPRFWSEPTA